MYNLILTKISKLTNFISLRELHREIEKNDSIALKTFMDYIDFTIQEKILYKIELYDFKKEKSILNKSKYYFSDNWIRNKLNNFNLDRDILIENLIFIKLNYYNFNIFSWINWSYEFTFFAKQKENIVYINIIDNLKKEELKKEINKLQKVPWKAKRYLVINNIDKLNLKKYIYNDVELISAEELIKKSL